MIVLSSFIFVLALNFVGFIIAYLLKSDKLTDLMYGLSFIAIAIYAFMSGTKTPSSAILLLLIFLWGTRIAVFLVIRIFNIKKDSRFDGIREIFWKFGFFWVMQAVTSLVIMILSIYFFQKDSSISWISIVGLCIWLIGFFFETVADIQKFRFNNNPNNAGKFINVGLWSLSRHPNYFGEIVMWCGIYIYVFSGLSILERFVSLSSPILIIVLLLFVTGIPKLEKYADKKWGKDKNYQKYKENTPQLIPKSRF